MPLRRRPGGRCAASWITSGTVSVRNADTEDIDRSAAGGAGV